jgi:hypothetical protein
MGAKRELPIFVGTAGVIELFASPTPAPAEADGPRADAAYAIGAEPVPFVHYDVTVRMPWPQVAAGARVVAEASPLSAPGVAVDLPQPSPDPGDRRFHLPAGRPLIVEGKARVAPPRVGQAWLEGPEPLVAGLDPITRRKLGEVWLAAALEEHAAVGAFARLALSLLSFGSSADLVGRTEQAALQEVEHARLCFTLASTYLGAPLEPGPLKVGGIGRNDPVDLALESWHGGCLGEGAAAAVARAARRRAHDPAVCAVLTIISRDEAAHAELAWDVLALALERGGRPVADALREAVARTPRTPEVSGEDPDDALTPLLGEHGWLSRADRARCAAEASRTAVRRAGWLLAPGNPSRPGLVIARS